jgi:hypothetical protein
MWNSFAADFDLLEGLNILEFDVTNQRQNGGNPTGLRVEFLDSYVETSCAQGPRGGAEVPIPPAGWLFASVLPMLWGARRKV